jgi:hypothetical protein
MRGNNTYFHNISPESNCELRESASFRQGLPEPRSHGRLGVFTSM